MLILLGLAAAIVVLFFALIAGIAYFSRNTKPPSLK